MQVARQLPFRRNAIGTASVCLLLAACGGGGGDSNDNGGVTPPPVTNQPASIDVASVTKAIPDVSMVIPICRKTTTAAPEVTTKNASGADLVKALRYAVTDGQAKAESLEYAKLPDEVAKKVTAKLDAIKVK